jgi:acetyl-CoA carboxylase beta subunit
MLIGNAQIVTCPYCGEEKMLLSLMSGNTFRATQWSDGKRIAPMLPEISQIQKCPECGKYYFRTEENTRMSDDEYSHERGTLTFDETLEAYHQFSAEGFGNDNQEENCRFMLHFAFNDYYHRTYEKERELTEEENNLYTANCLWLINHAITDDLMKAEYYREIGMMDEAKEIISKFNTSDNFHKNILKNISLRIEANDCSVFKL